MSTKAFARVTSMLLVLCMVIGLMPMGVFAAETDTLKTALDEAVAYADALTVDNSSNDPETVVKNFKTHFTWDNEKRENEKSYLFDWSYYNGVVFEGIEYLYEVTGDEKYKDYVVEYMSSLIASDGSWATCSNNSSKQCAGYNATHGADCYKTASLLLDAYEMTGDDRYLTMAETLYADLDSAAKSYSLSNAGNNYRHTWASDPSPDLWLDGLYMILPFRAEYAKYIGDTEELDLIVSRLQWVSDNMYDDATGLFYHAADNASSNSGTYWLRAIGWYAAALVDVMDSMEGENLETMKTQLVKLVDGMKACQNASNGMWRNNVLSADSSTNPYETSGTALVCYAVMKAVNNGWLDESYADMAILAFEGICNEKLDGDTLTDICFKGVPGSGNEKFYDNEGKGAGPFIMFTAEVQEYYDTLTAEPTVSYIQINEGDGAAYAQGDTLLFEVLVSYTDGTTAYVTQDECDVVVYDANGAEIVLADAMATVGTYSATVTYEGKDCTLTFTVGESEDFEDGVTSYDTLSLVIYGAELTADVKDVTADVSTAVESIGGITNYVAYDIAATLAEGAEAQVSIPVPTTWTVGELTVYHVTDEGTVSDEVIEGSYDAATGFYTFTAKHFSTYALTNEVAPAAETGSVSDTSNLAGETTTTYTLTDTLVDGEQYLIVSTNSGSGYALGSTTAGQSVTVTNSVITDKGNAVEWTANGSGSSWTFSNGSSYLGYENNGEWYNPDYALNPSGSETEWTVNGTNVSINLGFISTTDYYLTPGSTWSMGTSSANVYFFQKSSTTTPGAEVTLTVTPDSASLLVGKTQVLTPVVTASGTATTDYVISWSTGNGSVATVSHGTVTAVGAGSTTITATVSEINGTALTENLVVSIPVTVTAVTLNSISVSAPAITTCVHKDADFSGVTVTATYSDGSTAVVSNSDVTFTYAKAAGTQTVTATYEGKTATFDITVSEETVASQTVSGKTSFEFDQNTAADFTGLTCAITYNCGCTETIAASELEVAGYDITTPGTYADCPVTYNGTQIGTVTVVVNEKTAISGEGYLAGSFTYTLDTDGVDYGSEYKYLIVGSGDAYALTANGTNTGIVAVEINSNQITLDTNEYEWSFYNNSSVTGSTTYNTLISQDGGETWIYHTNSSIYVGNGTDAHRGYWQVESQGNGNYRIGDQDGSTWRLYYSNSKFTVRTNSSTYVRLFRLTDTSNGEKVTFTLDQSNVLILPGDVVELTGSVTVGSSTYDLADCDITWTSSKTNVATVANGTVTGVADGVTTVTATLTAVDGKSLAEPISLDVNVTVQSKAVASAELVGNDPVTTKLNVEPDFSNIKLNVVYDDGTSAVITTENGLIIEGYDITTVGYAYATISYAGKVYGTVRVTVDGNPYEGLDEATTYPEYPEDGAVRVRKTATELEFATTGVVQVELDVAGVSVKKAVDAVLTIDISNSMAWATGTTSADGYADYNKLDEVMAAVKVFAGILLADNDDGTPTNNTITIVTFAGFDNEHTPNTDAYIDSVRTLVTATSSLDVVNAIADGTYFSSADGITIAYIPEGQDQNTVDNVTSESGTNRGDTNYDYAFWQTEQAIVDGNLGGTNREIHVLFMTDGCASNYNNVYYRTNNVGYYYQPGTETAYTASTTYTTGTAWTNYIQNTLIANSNGNIYANNVYDRVDGMYGVGFDMANGSFAGIGTWDASTDWEAVFNTIVSKSVTDENGNGLIPVTAASDTDTLMAFYESMGRALRYAGTQAEVTDVIDSDFTLQMGNTTGTEGEGIGQTNLDDYNITPTITIKAYDLWTKEETDDTTLIGTRQKNEDGTYVVEDIETVTFSKDGTMAYSDLIDNGTTNILKTGDDGTVTIEAFYFTYTKTPEGVETFDWKLGNITDKEIALSFMAYLKGSLEGEQPNGLKYTNEEATLEYIDINGDYAHKTFPVPAVAWGGASTAYEFYLVNENGEPCDRNGVLVPFANRVTITGPFYEELYLNQEDENQAQEIVAAYVLPAGYVLYDETASYTVVTASGDHEGSLTISEPAENKAQTTIRVSATEPSFIQSHVAFGVLYNQIPEESEFVLTPDQVVIDYGKAIEIDVTANNTEVPGDVTAELIGFSKFYDTVDTSQQFSSTSSIAPYEATYGTFSISNGKVVYTPDALVNGVEKIFCVYKITATGNNVYYMVSELDVIPATIVYYETDFAADVFTTATTGTAWDTKSQGDAADGPQDDGTIGAGQTYGYDSTYINDAYLSNGSSLFVEGAGVKNTTVMFEFTGTGFDLISRTGELQGAIRVEIFTSAARSTDSRVKAITVLNKSESALELYQIPVVSVNDLDYGTYYVTIGVNAAYENADYPDLSRGGEFYFDAIRIYDPVKGDAIAEAAYNLDGEANNAIDEVRALLLDAETYATITGTTTGMVFVDNVNSGTDADGASGDVVIATYETVGPNNETYLSNGQAVAFKMKTGSIPASVDIGAKSITGSTAGLKVTIVKNDGTTVAWTDSETIASSTVQYIDLLDASGADASLFYQEVYVVITNTGDGVLSVTDIKVGYSNTASVEVMALDTGIALMSQTQSETTAYDPYAVSYTVDAGTYTMARNVLTAPEVEEPVEPEVPEETEPTEPEVPEETDPSEPEQPEDEPNYDILDASMKATGSLFNRTVTITVTTTQDVADVKVSQLFWSMEPQSITFADQDEGTRVWTIVLSGKATVFGSFYTITGYGADGTSGAPAFVSIFG